MNLLDRARAADTLLFTGQAPTVSAPARTPPATSAAPTPPMRRGAGLDGAVQSGADALHAAAVRMGAVAVARPGLDLEGRMDMNKAQLDRMLRDPRLPHLLELARAQRTRASAPSRDYQPEVGILLGKSMLVKEPKVYGRGPLVLYAPVVETNALGAKVDAFGNAHRGNPGVGTDMVRLGYIDQWNKSGFISPIERHHCADIEPAALERYLGDMIAHATRVQSLPRTIVGYAYEL